MSFFDKLEKRIKSAGTLLCTGLDPRIKGDDPYAELVSQNEKLIKQTAEFTACYKPNIAFYEAYGEDGLRALKHILSIIPEDIPVLLDAKRGDIGATAEAYAKACFEDLKADSVTLNPYMGKTSAEPFLNYKEKGFFFLCRTSNPEAEKIQQMRTINGTESDELYIEMAGQIISWSKNAGLVVAGNDYEALAKIRDCYPDVWLLAPGIGAQGGKAEQAAFAGVRDDGLGLLPVVVRAIANADDPAAAAKEHRDVINDAVKKALERRKSEPLKSGREAVLKDNVLKGLIQTECFKTGSFTLKSGKISPFYVDLRKISSNINLLWNVASAYAGLIKDLKCDHIAGIPIAGLPLATATSMITGIPLIFPRMTMKEHGTGNKVEGNYKAGDRVVLLDDLITTGKSKIEAVEILKSAGLIVEDLVVLLERGAQGRKDMDAAGINLFSFAQVEDLLKYTLKQGLINQDKLNELLEYIKE